MTLRAEMDAVAPRKKGLKDEALIFSFFHTIHEEINSRNREKNIILAFYKFLDICTVKNNNFLILSLTDR